MRTVSLDGEYHDRGDYRNRKKPKTTPDYKPSSKSELKQEWKPKGKKKVRFGYKGEVH